MSADVKATSPLRFRFVVPPAIISSLDTSDPLAPAANICCVRSLACVPAASSSSSTSPEPKPAMAHRFMPPAICQPT